MSDSDDQENEITALSSIYEEGIFAAAEDGKGGQFVVNVSLPSEVVHVQLDGPSGVSVVLKTGAKPVHRDGTDLLPVKFLPPIMLYFQYPEDYPSCNAPQYTLSCKWLSPRQLGLLCSHLDDLGEESRGEVILFMWIQFLQEESFSFLDLQDPLVLDYSSVRSFTRSLSREQTTKPISHQDGACNIPASQESGPDHRDPGDSDGAAVADKRAIQDVTSVASLIHSFVSHDAEQRQCSFDAGFYHCQICFEERMGTECLSFPQCDHVYCKGCLRDYFTVQISEGNVKGLHCPEQKCESQASQSQVRSLVSEELFARYDRLLLQLSLDGMDDVTRCPRMSCQCPVMKEENSNMAVCPSCHLAFCTLCSMAYHGVQACRIKKEDLKNLKEEYDGADEEGRRALEKKYGAKALKRLLEDSYSEMWIAKNSKNCPYCGSSIQKIDGCNKMACTKCHSYFCWLCLAKLSKVNPYQHFKEMNSRCYDRLFQGIERRDDDEDDDVLGEDEDDLYWFDAEQLIALL